MIRIRVSLLALAAAVCSCDESPELQEGSFHYSMSSVDTIGSLTGDDRFVFGDILRVETASDGSILVLDGIQCTIRRYSREGDYLGEYAGSGSGPGELTDPIDMAVLSDGRIAVADWGAWGIFFYDSTFHYSEYMGPMPGGSPMGIVKSAEGSVVGLGLDFHSGESQESGEYFLASWSDSPTDNFRFFRGPATVRRGEEGEVEISFPDVLFDSDSRGNLFAGLSTDSTFVIECYSPFGEHLGRIIENVSRTPLGRESSREITREAEASGDEIPIDLYARQIKGIYCDSSDRIWVRMGTFPFPFFRVYDYSGEFLGTVSCEELNDPLFELDFNICGETVFVWNRNPYDYPKIILLENPLEQRGA